jgi:hypothetical protein
VVASGGQQASEKQRDQQQIRTSLTHKSGSLMMTWATGAVASAALTSCRDLGLQKGVVAASAILLLLKE